MVEKKAAHCYEMLANFYQITWFYSQKIILLSISYVIMTTPQFACSTLQYTRAAQNYIGISLAYSSQHTT